MSTPLLVPGFISACRVPLSSHGAVAGPSWAVPPAGPQGRVWCVCGRHAPQILARCPCSGSTLPLYAHLVSSCSLYPHIPFCCVQVCEHSISISSARLPSQMAAPACPNPSYSSDSFLPFRLIPDPCTPNRQHQQPWMFASPNGIKLF